MSAALLGPRLHQLGGTLLNSVIALALLATAAATPRASAELSATERQINQAVSARRETNEALLEALVNINSGTLNLDGVEAVGQRLATEFQALGLETEWLDLREATQRAGHLLIRTPNSTTNQNAPLILMIGHLDTVFEADSPFQRFERLGNDRARGPGVTDMKGGDVVILAALQALHDAQVLTKVRVVVVMTGDEERTGRPLSVSRKALIDAAKEADYILGFENSLDLTSATIARRGSSGWTLKVTGTRGHSSQVFSDRLGAGAIFETARVLDSFYSHLRGERYLTFNPGTVVGGTDISFDGATAKGTTFGKTNVVAQAAEVRGGLRFITEGQRERARAAMRAIVAQPLPGTKSTIEFRDGYPAMPPTDGNRALFDQLSTVAQDLGGPALSPVDPGRRGAADISFVAQYAPALAGLGPVGEQLHAVGEQLVLSSIPTMATRTAVLLHRLSQPLTPVAASP